MNKKIKIYRMSISRVFPATHPRKGQDTDFKEKILSGLDCPDCICELSKTCENCHRAGIFKIHTIRANYDYWKKRIDEVNAGNAILVLYEWKGKPYSKDGTRELFRFDKDSGIDVQLLTFNPDGHQYLSSVGVGDWLVKKETLAINDGLSEQDFRDWFKGYDLSEPMAIIHFTKFRY